MFQLGSSFDTTALAIFTIISVGWPMVLAGGYIGWCKVLFLESIIMIVIGGVLTYFWALVVGAVQFGQILKNEIVMIWVVCLLGAFALMSVARFVVNVIQKRAK